MESPESSLVPGYRLDRYELLCPIASGGMASVWLGRLRGKRGFEKLYAIKTIKTELISDPHFQEMFLDEARIASRIIHPNVAQTLELGEQEEILYIVMEHVDGESVAKLHRLALKQGTPLPAGIALRIVADACAGLHAAHQLKEPSGESLGVVHRDVSPQNILLTSGGVAKVIDFGLVKAKNRSATETKSGVVKGKIRYMAPEQVGGKVIDHRADVWAAGMCLYELVTGRLPYHDEDDLDVVKRLMGDNPLPTLDASIPLPIQRILARAIVRDPAARFESCSAMRKAIETAVQELGVPAHNDDVADFVRMTLPDLASKREKTVARAIEAADASTPGSVQALEPGDMAYAVTEVVNRDRTHSESHTIPLTQRKSSSSYSHTPSGSTLRDQLGEQRRRGTALYWAAGLAAIAFGAWMLWPRGAPPPPIVTAPSASSPLAAPVPMQPVPTGTIELDPPAPTLMKPSQLPNAAPLSPRVATVGRPSAEPATDGGAAAAPGLSPGALSAARIMLAPPATEVSPAPPAPTGSVHTDEPRY